MTASDRSISSDDARTSSQVKPYIVKSGYTFPVLLDKVSHRTVSAHYTVQTAPRQRPDHVKEQIVIDRQFENQRLQSEHVAEFNYRPTACKESYRMVVVRKNISVEKGEQVPRRESDRVVVDLERSDPGGEVDDGVDDILELLRGFPDIKNILVLLLREGTGDSELQSLGKSEHAGEGGTDFI